MAQINIKNIPDKTLKLFRKHADERSMKMNPLIIRLMNEFIEYCEIEKDNKRIIRGDKEY